MAKGNDPIVVDANVDPQVAEAEQLIQKGNAEGKKSHKGLFTGLGIAGAAVFGFLLRSFIHFGKKDDDSGDSTAE